MNNKSSSKGIKSFLHILMIHLGFQFDDSEENRLYRKFLNQWEKRYGTTMVNSKEEKSSQKETKVFDFKTKKFVISKV